MRENIRVLLAKPMQDGHDRGVRFMLKKFRDAGFEVIFMNFLLATELVTIAMQEDVDVIGVSSSSHGHVPVFEDLMGGLAEQGMDDILVIGGGVIPGSDAQTLKDLGVSAIFGPGSTADQAISHIRENVREL